MGCRRLHVVINLTEERLSYTCVVNNSPYPADKTQNPLGRVSEAPPDTFKAHILNSQHAAKCPGAISCMAGSCVCKPAWRVGSGCRTYSPAART